MYNKVAWRATLKDTSALDSEVCKEHQNSISVPTLSTDRADHSVQRPLCEETLQFGRKLRDKMWLKVFICTKYELCSEPQTSRETCLTQGKADAIKLQNGNRKKSHSKIQLQTMKQILFRQRLPLSCITVRCVCGTERDKARLASISLCEKHHRRRARGRGIFTVQELKENQQIYGN